MVYHSPSKANTKSVLCFINPCWSILGIVCGQYRCDPLVILLVQWCINSDIHTLMSWVGCQHMYEWLELMVQYKPSKAENKSARLFIHPWYILGYDPCFVLLVQWCANLTHTYIDELKGVPTHLSMVGAHGTSHIILGREWKWSGFHPFTHGTSFGCYVASMGVFPLLGSVYTGGLTSHMQPSINWEVCQLLHQCLGLMVHLTLSKAKSRTEWVFIHPCWSILGIVCGW